MRTTIILAGALMVLCVSNAFGQHYDPFFSLNGEAGSKGVTATLSAGDVADIAKGDIMIMGKTAINDQIEVGVNIGSGVLADGGSAFSHALIGAKYGLGESRAATVNLLAPVGDHEDPGLAIGIQNVQEIGGMSVNEHLQISLLKGFAPVGVGIDLFLEPVKEINDKMIFYFDVFVSTNTDNIGDWLSIDVAPNLDYMLSDTMALNVGIALNAYDGIARDEDIGIGIALVAGL